MKRRGFLGLLAGVAAAPLLPALPIEESWGCMAVGDILPLMAERNKLPLLLEPSKYPLSQLVEAISVMPPEHIRWEAVAEEMEKVSGLTGFHFGIPGQGDD